VITEANPETGVVLVSPLTSLTGVMQMHLAAGVGKLCPTGFLDGGAVGGGGPARARS